MNICKNSCEVNVYDCLANVGRGEGKKGCCFRTQKSGVVHQEVGAHRADSITAYVCPAENAWPVSEDGSGWPPPEK